MLFLTAKLGVEGSCVIICNLLITQLYLEEQLQKSRTSLWVIFSAGQLPLTVFKSLTSHSHRWRDVRLGMGARVALDARGPGDGGGGGSQKSLGGVRVLQALPAIERGRGGGVRGSHAPFPAVSASQVCEPQWLPVQSMTHCIVIGHCERPLRGETPAGVRPSRGR